MNLAWLSYWWKRMEREAVRENIMKKEMKESTEFIKFFDSIPILPDAPKTGSLGNIKTWDVK